MPVTFEHRPVEKPQHKRGKPSRKQRSELPPKEVERLKERSGDVCERCDRSRATGGKAHVQRRWKSNSVPAAEDFIHLCASCHTWADSCQGGRAWLIQKQKEIKGLDRG